MSSGQLTVFDTSVIYALLDRHDRDHGVVLDWFHASDPHPVTTPLVLAEVDHLAGNRAGHHAQAAWRRDLADGAYTVEWWDEAPKQLAEIAERYRDLGIGLTDASLVALAARLGTAEVATLDERHFRAGRPLTHHRAFRLLPADA